MSANKTVKSPGVLPKPKRPLHPALAANIWKPGQSGNPHGYQSQYAKLLALARSMSVDALQRQIELAELDRRDAEGNLLPLSPDADRRLVAVSTNSIIERAYGKPREYDPNDPREKPKIDFNPADYTYEQRRQIDDTIKMMRAVQAEKMAAKGEVIPPYDR